MKKFKKIFVGTLTSAIVAGACTTSVFAAEKNFTYNFKHQLAVKGKQKATKNSASFNIYTTTNESNRDTFTIKQFSRSWARSRFVTSRTIYCGANSKGSCSFPTTKGTTYSYEFWKKNMIGYIVGSGKISY